MEIKIIETDFTESKYDLKYKDIFNANWIFNYIFTEDKHLHPFSAFKNAISLKLVRL
jgi:hypothetical protein